MKYDFGGYATKNDLRCGDGRIIRAGAFASNDGAIVPLVWQHVHDNPMNVLGHAQLENRADGVYAYCSFNDTEQGKHGKELVRHGDVDSLSIYANRLQQDGPNVLHGDIKEVSLVLAGANPGAHIDNIAFAHADGSSTPVNDEAIIYSGAHVFISHADEPEKNDTKESEKKDVETKADSDSDEGKTVQDIWNTFTEEQKQLGYYMMAVASGVDPEEAGGDAVEHADGPTIEEVYNTLNEEQKNALNILVGAVLAAAEDDTDEDVDENDEDELEQSDFYDKEYTMHHNIFEQQNDTTPELSHAEVMAAFEDAPRYGSLKQSFLQHGITDISVLFPEAKTVTTTPDFLSRQMDWVKTVMDGTHKSPFSRIRSTVANITADEARARGYLKGHQKVEEQMSLFARTTPPQTIYKLQKLDRDDIVDITDLDVVQWLKGEMEMMLREEIARAILVGDGRDITSNDKIKPDNVRPIYGDADTYVIYYDVPAATTTLTDADQLVDAALNARTNYRGSGNLTFFATAEVINSMLTARDRMGRRLYETRDSLAAALGVTRVVEVPVMAGLTRNNKALKAILVNLNDYTVGADKGGEVTLFDDFDIDYNKYSYLIETRMSGALTHPYSAIVLEAPAASTNTTVPDDGE